MDRNDNQFKTLICNKSIFNNLPLIDNLNKNTKYSIALSGGGARSFCFCVGIFRSFLRRNSNFYEKIEYLSCVSGSSWISSILTYSKEILEDILLFEIDETFQNLSDNPTINSVVYYNIDNEIYRLLYTRLSDFSNLIINKYLLSMHKINDDFDNIFSRRINWPVCIINSCHQEDQDILPIEYLEDYTILTSKCLHLCETKDLLKNKDLTINKEIENKNEEQICNILFLKDRSNTKFNDLEDNSQIIIKKSPIKLTQNKKEISLTNAIASSSAVLKGLPFNYSYNLNLTNCNKNEINIYDGGFLDATSISSLLRRKCKKILCCISTVKRNEIIDIDYYLNTNFGTRNDIFDKEEINRMKKVMNRQLKDGEICMYRNIFKIKSFDNSQTVEYETEILFYFLSKVHEFMVKIPNEIKELPEMKNFPNFDAILENPEKIISLTKIQSYSLVLLSEFCFNEVYNRNIDFFEN
uniref:PNPLA domain-containing protein n=1 Tax=viral metagenome TaxID=1070528 RepID=A0A6C0BF50_9ZZZZ